MLNIQSPLSGIRSPFGRRGGFSPLALFANDEPGVWYDPSDLSTLFQDTAGTTPVTTAGQTVALMLDKSKGLTLGPELVTNGDFSSATGWSTTRILIAGGVASFADNTLGASELSRADVMTVSGKTYEVSFTASATSSGTFFVVVGGTFHTVAVVAGDNRIKLTAGATPTDFRLRANVLNVYTGTVDNISVRELPGYHATQATAAARPEYAIDGSGFAHLLDDEVDDSLTATIPDLGANATLAYATDAGTTILTGQTISAGSFEALRGVRTYAVIAVDRALTAAETTNVTAYLDAKRGA